eukprot:scaffold7670_cov160-Amphora_coffeaeformis.AAC.9
MLRPDLSRPRRNGLGVGAETFFTELRLSQGMLSRVILLRHYNMFDVQGRRLWMATLMALLPRAKPIEALTTECSVSFSIKVKRINWSKLYFSRC